MELGFMALEIAKQFSSSANEVTTAAPPPVPPTLDPSVFDVVANGHYNCSLL